MDGGGKMLVEVPKIFNVAEPLRVVSIGKLAVFYMDLLAQACQEALVINKIGRGDDTQRAGVQVNGYGNGYGAFDGRVGSVALFAEVFEGHVATEAETYHYYFIIIFFQMLHHRMGVIGDATVVKAALAVYFPATTAVVDHGYVPSVFKENIGCSPDVLRSTVALQAVQ